MSEWFYGTIGLLVGLLVGGYLTGRYVLAQIPLKEAAARQALYEAKEAELRVLTEMLDKLKRS